MAIEMVENVKQHALSKKSVASADDTTSMTACDTGGITAMCAQCADEASTYERLDGYCDLSERSHERLV